MGPDSFDCSGFILRTVQDVTGGRDGQPTHGARHVRDMWSAALADVHPFRMAELTEGALIIMRRRYEIGGKVLDVAGHIGILTDAEDMTFLHASPHTGRVEERRMLTTQTILGSIAIKP